MVLMFAWLFSAIKVVGKLFVDAVVGLVVDTILFG
jgi:hypothetical protein